jgi:zinc protease
LVVAAGLSLSQISAAGIPIGHWTQPSGVRVYLATSPGIPMVDVQIDFDAGARREPASKAGLASLMAGSTSNGVRGKVSEPALDENGLSEAWADLGASFGGNAGADRMTFSLRSLTYPDLLAKAAALAARQLAEPTFPEKLWLRDRPKLVASLREADTRPATVASKAFLHAVYGAHPYGNEMTPATLARIGVQDMRALHAQAIKPCNAKVSIVGALDRAQADALVTQMFARLPASSCPPLPAVPEILPLHAPQEQRLAFASAQAHVLVGQPGYKRDDPDFFALTVGNHILGGGGFTSRLTE